MKVLWLATSPSLFKEEVVMGWIGSLEHVVRTYCPDIDLGIAFEYSDGNFKVRKNGVTYYPLDIKCSKRDVVKMKFNGNDNWYLKRPLLKDVIADFNPDIIHCFGSEWNWGLIAEETDVPIVLHMQGFINLYIDAEGRVNKKTRNLWYNIFHPRKALQGLFLKSYNKKRCEVERRIMRSCSFFMGRTDWDKGIVKYYSPGSKYYHCAEAIRPTIYNSEAKWSLCKQDKIQIVTIASAGNLKGNGIILETAKILKDLGIDFEWRVSGSKGIFSEFEYTTGINAKDVNVKLLGYIDVERVKDELLSAEIFVLPSIMDNSPNSLCEAQLIGTPVIATNVGGIPQMVENGKTGILYPYNEPHTLAFKILDLHDSPDKLIELSKNEIKMAHNRHNPMLLGQRLQDVYSDIINIKNHL